jgi:predicted regulator of Ras-like GTPase activity (Roadblock/LC7/MglB family)
VSDLGDGLEELAGTIGGVRAALVIETSGIEVATWGDADFETSAAELAELWRQVEATETCAASGPLKALDLVGADGTWMAVPLGAEYMLALLCDSAVPPGRARFYASEWTRDRHEDFA